MAYFNGVKGTTAEMNVKRKYHESSNKQKGKTRNYLIFFYMLIFSEAWDNADTPKVSTTQSAQSVENNI